MGRGRGRWVLNLALQLWLSRGYVLEPVAEWGKERDRTTPFGGATILPSPTPCGHGAGDLLCFHSAGKEGAFRAQPQRGAGGLGPCLPLHAHPWLLKLAVHEKPSTPGKIRACRGCCRGAHGSWASNLGPWELKDQAC